MSYSSASLEGVVVIVVDEQDSANRIVVEPAEDEHHPLGSRRWRIVRLISSTAPIDS